MCRMLSPTSPSVFRKWWNNIPLDLVVENSIILELKSCDSLEPIHKAQLLTYLKISGFNLGLLLNFNVAFMRDGIVRIVNEFKE